MKGTLRRRVTARVSRTVADIGISKAEDQDRSSSTEKTIRAEKTAKKAVRLFEQPAPRYSGPAVLYVSQAGGGVNPLV